MRRNRFQSILRMAACACIASGTALAQSRPSRANPLPYGMEGFTYPPSTRVPATPPRVVRLLIEALSTNPVPERRVELLQDLGESQSPDALETVVKAMSDREAVVRGEAAWAAGMIGAKSAIETLRRLQKDPDVRVRILAMRAGVALGEADFVNVGLVDADEACMVAACGLSTTSEQRLLIAERIAALSASGKRIAVRALSRDAGQAHASLLAAQLADRAQAGLVIDGTAGVVR